MNTKKDITIIIPVFNGETSIKGAVNSLEMQNYINRVKEVIIINDYSTDQSYEIVKSLREKYKNINLVENKKNLGLAETFNKGINLCKTKFLFLMQQDIILKDNNCIEKSITPLLNSKNIIATFPTIILTKETWLKFNFWQKSMFSRFVNKTFSSDLIGKFDCYNKGLLLKHVGCFRGNLFRTAGEDTDMKFRIQEKGFIVVKTPTQVIHIHTKEKNFSLLKWIRKEIQLGEARGALFKLHKMKFLIESPIFFLESF